jgi:transcription-repair coupling factor (superfamily II helicase)
VLIGHGQMEEKELESVMGSFVAGKADVLVSTTIIESGLDIPNANTIIIDRADRFGLSELYQLRGRVGRYKHQAYAYLLLPRHAQLLTEARKRMSAIKQYSALGSGFKIAMRDLEIRGAGNLLGAQQSGHITAVGFDLYCQLLGQSISSLKGESPKPRVDVRTRIDFLALNPAEATPIPSAPSDTVLDPNRPRLTIRVPRDSDVWSTDDDEDDDSTTRSGRGRKKRTDEAEGPATREPAFLPLDYIREPAQRIEVHRKLAQLADKAGLDTLRRELRDRFGPLPPPVDLLLELAELRLFAASHRVTGIEVTEGKLKLTRNNDLITIGGQFPRLTKRTASARIAEIRRLIQSLGK